MLFYHISLAFIGFNQMRIKPDLSKMRKDLLEIFELAFHERVDAESCLPERRNGLAAVVVGCKKAPLMDDLVLFTLFFHFKFQSAEMDS